LTEKKICVFSLSERDEAFGHKDMKRAKSWLINKDERPYYFAEKSPKDGLPRGSIVLFSFDAQIFGQATVKEDVEEVPFDEQEARRRMGRPVYKHSMIFNGSSIEIFPYNPTKKEITEKLHIRFGQVFRYINQKEYQEILKMARMQRT
jgi:hypothetical protein